MADESGTDAEETSESVEPDQQHDAGPDTEALPVAEPTEVLEAQAETVEAPLLERGGERRFTAPSGMDAGATQKIDKPVEPATEVLSVHGSPSAPTEPVATPPAPPMPPILPPRNAGPQVIPPRAPRRRSWVWVLVLVLVIAALAAVVILGTVWLTQKNSPKVSQEDRVKQTIRDFDVAVQAGDLAKLRTITCGSTRDAYVNYDDNAWKQTHDRVAAAKQYPVVASIDQVVVDGDHAEANVTTFMAFDSATRSTRSFDLQFRDDQWKICQAPNP
jgi:hypothetical protein